MLAAVIPDVLGVLAGRAGGANFGCLDHGKKATPTTLASSRSFPSVVSPWRQGCPTVLPRDRRNRYRQRRSRIFTAFRYLSVVWRFHRRKRAYGAIFSVPPLLGRGGARRGWLAGPAEVGAGGRPPQGLHGDWLRPKWLLNRRYVRKLPRFAAGWRPGLAAGLALALAGGANPKRTVQRVFLG